MRTPRLAGPCAHSQTLITKVLDKAIHLIFSKRPGSFHVLKRHGLKIHKQNLSE
jgi:hypothetical protein